MMTVREKGAAWVALPTESWRPAGLVANDRVTVFGCRLTLVVAERPFESVAVSLSTRYEG
jgi:hypothetical protein